MVAAYALPPVDAMAQNILTVAERATAEDWAAGMSWYAHARALAESLASDYGTTVELAAGVIAVLSAGTEWEENRRLAIDAYRVWHETRDVAKVKDLAATASSRSGGSNLTRAGRILSTDSTADVERTHRTRKVNAFWLSLLGATDLPCVDRHAARVALGDVLGPDDGPTTDAAYALFADAYRKAAAQLGEHPRDLQAVTWIVCKRERDAWRLETAGTVL